MLSQCDVVALAFVFAWALKGSEPYPPGERPLQRLTRLTAWAAGVPGSLGRSLG